MYYVHCLRIARLWIRKEVNIKDSYEKKKKFHGPYISCLKAVVLKPECASGSRLEFVKTHFARLLPLNFSFRKFQWGHKLYVSKFPGDGGATDPDTTL